VNDKRYWQHKFTLIVMACIGEPEPSDDWVEITQEEYYRIIEGE